jgi:hypothetical protein
MNRIHPQRDYEQALAVQAQLESAVSRASAALAIFPRLPNGLTPDHVKASPEYRAAKLQYDTAFGKLRTFNASFVKSFRAELRRDRTMKRLAAARNNPNHPYGVLCRVVSQGTPIAGIPETETE